MRLFLPTVVAVVVSLVPLRATTVFTNFQSAIPGDCVVTALPGGIACAAAFTPSANYVMTDAQVKVAVGSSDGNFDLFLYSNNSGLPGSSLGMIGAGSAPLGSYGIVTLNSPALSLVSGTEYWLVMAPHDPSTLGVGWANGGNPVPPTASAGWPSPSWGASSNSSQFQIDGTQPSSVPEPATLGLVVSGMLFVVRNTKLPGSNRMTLKKDRA